MTEATPIDLPDQPYTTDEAVTLPPLVDRQTRTLLPQPYQYGNDVS